MGYYYSVTACSHLHSQLRTYLYPLRIFVQSSPPISNCLPPLSTEISVCHHLHSNSFSFSLYLMAIATASLTTFLLQMVARRGRRGSLHCCLRLFEIDAWQRSALECSSLSSLLSLHPMWGFIHLNLLVILPLLPTSWIHLPSPSNSSDTTAAVLPN